jgi:hypothetical protein
MTALTAKLAAGGIHDRLKAAATNLIFGGYRLERLSKLPDVRGGGHGTGQMHRSRKLLHMVAYLRARG